MTGFSGLWLIVICNWFDFDPGSPGRYSTNGNFGQPGSFIWPSSISGWNGYVTSLAIHFGAARWFSDRCCDLDDYPDHERNARRGSRGLRAGIDPAAALNL